MIERYPLIFAQVSRSQITKIAQAEGMATTAPTASVGNCIAPADSRGNNSKTVPRSSNSNNN
jgi:hypothetical protein